MLRSYAKLKKIRRAIVHAFKEGSITNEVNQVIENIANEVKSLNEMIEIPTPTLTPIVLFINSKWKSNRFWYVRGIRIFWRIKRSRGLLRWICSAYLTSISENFNSAFSASKSRLILNLLRHQIPILRLLSGHCEFRSLIPDKDQAVIRVTSADLVGGYIPPKIRDIDIYIIDTGSPRWPQKYRRLTQQVSVTPFTQELFIWNSFYALSLLDYTEKKTERIFEYFGILNIENGWEVIPFSVPPQSLKTFDEIYEEMPRSNWISEVCEAEIWHSIFVIHDGGLVLTDATMHPMQEFVAGTEGLLETRQLIWREKCRILKPISDLVQIECGFLLTGRADRNWYHFILDTLPKIRACELLDSTIPILIRDDLPESAIKILESLTCRSLIRISKASRYKVQRLYFMPVRSNIFDSRPKLPLRELHLSPYTILWLRNKILKSYGGLSRGVTGSSSQCRELNVANLLYIPRFSHTRRIINERSIIKATRRANFHVVPEVGYLYRDQVELFMDARIVIVAGGSAATNMIFMREDTTIILLLARNSAPKLWTELATTVNLNYLEVRGPQLSLDTKRPSSWHANYYIPISRLRRSMVKLLYQELD